MFCGEIFLQGSLRMNAEKITCNKLNKTRSSDSLIFRLYIYIFSRLNVSKVSIDHLSIYLTHIKINIYYVYFLVRGNRHHVLVCLGR